MEQPPRADEQFAIEPLLRPLDFHDQELRIIDAALGRAARRTEALDDDPRPDAVALSIVTAGGDFRRFRHPSGWCPFAGSTRGSSSQRAAR